MKKPTPFKSENLYSGVRVHESEQKKNHEVLFTEPRPQPYTGSEDSF